MKNVATLLVVLVIGLCGGYFARMAFAESRLQKNLSALSPDLIADVDRLGRVLGNYEKLSALERGMNEKWKLTNERMDQIVKGLPAEWLKDRAFVYAQIDKVGWARYKQEEREALEGYIRKMRTPVEPETEKMLLGVFPGMITRPEVID